MPMQRTHSSTISSSGLVLASLLVLMAGCRQPQAEHAPDHPQPAYKPTATVKDLMQSLIDVNADVVWLAVTAESTSKGLIETKPKTDEEWAKVRHGAIALSEAANLLMIPGRRVARPGEKSEVPGIELEPEEMDALIAKDRAAWNRRATALHDAALQTLTAIDAKNAEKVFELGATIEETCEGCHRHYWYPNEVVPDSVPEDAPHVGQPSAAKPENNEKK